MALKKMIGIASAIAFPAAFVDEDECAARVTTEHKWWTREGGHLKLHSVKIGTIGTIRQKDLDEFKRLCEDIDSANAEQKANQVVSMLIQRGYRIVSLYTYDSK